MKNYHLFILLFALICACCNDDNMPMDDDTGGGSVGIDLTNIEHNPTSYDFPTPMFFPEPNLPADNPLTHEGIELGRRLFYDPIVDNEAGPRNTMALINLAFVPNLTLNWDGKFHSLAEQAIEPVENPIELDESWDNVEEKLRNDSIYRQHFREAFDIENSNDITRDLATKAIEQFELTLVSSDSYYDRAVVRVESGIFLEENEVRGMKLFQDEGATGLKDAQCWHCHSFGANKTLFTNGGFFNNGLDSVDSLADFEDFGHGDVTGDLGDNGRFKAPTLRNIALTAPYMHDGRFATLGLTVDGRRCKLATRHSLLATRHSLL